jgi:hypothetical protein
MLALALAAGLTLGPRPAQIVKPGEEATYAAWLEGEIRKTAGIFAGKDCSSAEVQSIGGAPLQDIVVRQHPEIFFWLEAAHLRGCGQAQVQQLGVVRDGDGWRALTMAPGSAWASPSSQRGMEPSLMKLGAAVALKSDRACTADRFAKSFRVVDTGQIDPHTPMGVLETRQLDLHNPGQVVDTRLLYPRPAGAPWSEQWSLYACNANFKVIANFRPNPDGSVSFEIGEQPSLHKNH